MSFRKQKGLRRSISTQINIMVFIIYSVVALTMVTLHITAEFRHSRSLIIDNLLKFQRLYQDTLVSILVSKDQNLIISTLKHQLQYPDLLGIKIEESGSQRLISQIGICESTDDGQLYFDEQGKTSIVKTGFLQSGLVEHNYILEFSDGLKLLRSVEITLYSGNGNLFEKAKVSFYYVIINALLISLVLGFSYINISKILLTRPLSALTSAAQSISMDNLEHFKLLVETPNQNELKILEKSFVRMVRQLFLARKKLEIGILNLKRIAEEGLKISSQRSYHQLSDQVKRSFSKITDLSGDVVLVFSGKLFEKKDAKAFYFVGEDDKSIIEVSPRDDFNKESHTDRFNILDTKDRYQLAEVRFVNHYTHGIDLKNVEPIFRPLLTNISNTIKNISMVKEIQKYVKSLEQNNIALLQMDKLKDEFLANTSHELRTPLNGIIGISESLLDGIGGDVSEEQARNLLMITQSGKKLSHLINDILDFSKMKNKELQLDMQQTSIFTCLEIVLGLLIPVVKEKNIQLINEVSYEIKPVYADENRLQQILFNLIGNAIKFTNDGKVTISAKEMDNFIEMSIADTGIGISDIQLDKIFSPFEQFDGTIAKEYSGTGLGLSISKSLIEQQGGTIQVKSIENVGSVFSFTLPKFNMQTYLDKRTGCSSSKSHPNIISDIYSISIMVYFHLKNR
jgi:signal transduction histidine kinase/HAMP domain-containing protein